MIKHSYTPMKSPRGWGSCLVGHHLKLKKVCNGLIVHIGNYVNLLPEANTLILSSNLEKMVMCQFEWWIMLKRLDFLQKKGNITFYNKKYNSKLEDILYDIDFDCKLPKISLNSDLIKISCLLLLRACWNG